MTTKDNDTVQLMRSLKNIINALARIYISYKLKVASKPRTSFIAPLLITIKHFGPYAGPAENIRYYLPFFLMRSRRNVIVSRFSFI